jgi:L-amino acid N-acyltransferase YncA
MSVRTIPLTEEHWPEVLVIYTEGIATGRATFKSEVPDWERCAYAGVVDDSIYVSGV